MQEIKGMIQEDGYDSIRYANEVENKYGNLPGLTPQGKAKVAELQKEITAISKKLTTTIRSVRRRH